MLRELRIKDYAIIDEVSLCFDDGLNVITGETGTGKSILIEALTLILGGRFTSEVIRQGLNEAVLEARFDPPPHSNPPDDPVDHFILKRVLSRLGKNRVYLNGSLANLSSLRQIGQKTVEIHGQQETHNLTDINHHLFLLDCFGQILVERSRYKSDYREWVRLQGERNVLEERAVDGRRQASFIEHQLAEIKRAKLDPNEEASLEKEERFLNHASEIVLLAEKAYARLSEEGGVLTLIDEIERSIQKLHDVTEDAASEIALLETSKIQQKELAILLRDRLEGEHHPERLQEVRERLYLIQRIKKKHGFSSIEEIFIYQNGLEKELRDLLTLNERCNVINEQVNELEIKLKTQAAALSRMRNKIKGELETKVKSELSLLGMEKTIFKISFEDVPLSETGNERVEFLIAQPGEHPQGITKIASGGELSRIMLALKVVLAEVDPVPTLIFDEIDAGIGGAVAERVGRRLSRLARSHQVFCITHLPQIASMADHHYFVEKESQSERVATSVKELSKEERVMELARMLGGVTITPITLRHAEEMMDLKLESKMSDRSGHTKK